MVGDRMNYATKHFMWHMRHSQLKKNIEIVWRKKRHRDGIGSKHGKRFWIMA